jgi:hypothetical protein
MTALEGHPGLSVAVAAAVVAVVANGCCEENYDDADADDP